jgi:hypothetical protein
MIITADDFKKYLNENNITLDTPNNLIVKKEIPNDHSSLIHIQSEQDYNEYITIEFSLKFQHHEFEPEGRVFQREFAIEHHPENKSTHTKPHLQFYIHGTNDDNKVGDLWLTLELENDDEYESCIKGFLTMLDDIADICKEGLDEELLNTRLLETLTAEKQLLLAKIKNSLLNNKLEYTNSEGVKMIITPENIPKITARDNTLIPFFK